VRDPLTGATALGLIRLFSRSNYNGVDTALLPLPVAKSVSAETSTGNNATLVLDFKKQILTSLNTGSFNDFFNAVTNTAEVSFNLHGGANGKFACIL
jgi:hypothetical protein